ncbi:MAG: hypothetical protein LBV20_06525 [Treponema sp.]|jgi:hypothetical protein|nr:hypothetical protein [Treponema sp.]
MKNIFLPEYAKTKRLLIVLFVFMMIMAALSCKQSSIFFNISTEVAPNDPKIPGAPSKIVTANLSGDHGLEGNGKLYLARSVIWSYDGDTWEKMINQPTVNGDIVDVAATSNELFTLAIDESENEIGISSELWKTADGTSWGTAAISNTTGYVTHSIYAVDGELFAAGVIRDPFGGEDYALLWYDETNNKLVSLKDGMGGTGRLTGAVHAGGFYYLATSGGIYVLTSPAEDALQSAVPLPTSTGKGHISGIIADQAQANLLAVTTLKENPGRILTAPVTAAPTFTEKNNYIDVRFNGALNIAETTPGVYVLMVGYESEVDIYNFGYREIVLDGGAFPNTINALDIPGSISGSTVAFNPKSEAVYESSLGREIISSVIQTPVDIDPDQTLFASTYTKGLWSYRNNNGVWEWNAEE